MADGSAGLYGAGDSYCAGNRTRNIGDGFDMHIPKGYIYFAMAFSVLVEMLNLKQGRSMPVKLHQPHLENSGET